MTGADTAEGPEAGAFRSAHMACILTDVTTFGLRPSPHPFGRRPPASTLWSEASDSDLRHVSVVHWLSWGTTSRSKERSGRLQAKATDFQSNCTTKSQCEANAKTQRAKGQRPTDAKVLFLDVCTSQFQQNTLSSQDCQPQPSPSFVCRAAACMDQRHGPRAWRCSMWP